MITFENVSKKFGQRPILGELNFTVNQGEFISVVGPSGSGKSTILHLILRLEQPSEGRILVGAKDLGGFSHHDLQNYRRSIGTVFQDYKLLPGKSVFENVAFPLEICDYAPAEVSRLTKEALEKLELTHLQDQLPEQLSGGEAQRVALARAVVHKPRLILADEPTGHLDEDNARRVAQHLLRLNMEGIAIILTTHNQTLVELLNQRVFHLHNGNLLF